MIIGRPVHRVGGRFVQVRFASKWQDNLSLSQQVANVHVTVGAMGAISGNQGDFLFWSKACYDINVDNCFPVRGLTAFGWLNIFITKRDERSLTRWYSLLAC